MWLRRPSPTGGAPGGGQRGGGARVGDRPAADARAAPVLACIASRRVRLRHIDKGVALDMHR
jgi:hypothetical protein